MSGSQDQCSRVPDASLYVLGQLQGRQHESFARHLRRCEECADEVELLEQAAEAVPLLSARQAPAPEDLIEQRPPTLAVAASNARAASTARAASNARTAAAGQLLGAQSATSRPVLRPIEGGAAPGSARSGGGRRLLKNPVPKPALVGFFALAVLAIATLALTQRAASVRYYRIQAGWSGGGAALQLLGDRLRLLVEGMPKPSRGRGYEVWVVDRSDKQLRPTGAWLHLNALGQAGVSVPGDYHNWLAVTVYTEPLVGRDTTSSGAAVVGDLRNLN